MNSSPFPAKSARRIAAFLFIGAFLLALPLAGCGTDDESEFGTLVLTVSGLPVEDAANVTVTGPAGFSQAVSDSETIGGLEAGTYEVVAEGVVVSNAAMDDFYEPVPSRKTVEVRAGERAMVDIEYRLTVDPPIATTGRMDVVVTGLPAGTEASITVTGPAGYEAVLTGSEVLLELEPGSYAVSAAEVEAGGDFYVPTVDPSPAEVEVDAVTQVDVVYQVVILAAASQ